MTFSRIICLAIIVLSGLFLSACLEIEERLSLKSDGSGMLVSTIDMGAMLSNPLIAMGMQEEMKKNGEEMPERIDSNLNIIEEMIELNPQWTADDLALLNRVESRMVMDMEAGEGAVTVNIPFDNLAQLERIQDLMTEAKEPEKEEEAEGNPFSGMTGGNTTNDFEWKKGKFSRLTTMTIGDELMGAMGMDEETMGMVEMMFGDAKMYFVMEMPGKIKKVKGFEGATVDGNVITQEFEFMELIKETEKINAAMDGQIKYKK
ncbi:hypothetical protein CEQ90_03825 [Lewinellaceae bacterium SD302]|nr:hypothetical protein CEQ90_03825 [Lewinellaceae bacterium SD302]